MAHNEEKKQKLREQRRQDMENRHIHCLRLIDVEGLTFEAAQELLRVNSEIRLEEIEDETNKKIKCYTIKKTFADIAENFFDRTDILTWDLRSVKNEFDNTTNKRKYDWIEVVCGVTADSHPLPNDETEKIESDKRSALCTNDMYAIAFKQTLIHHFAFGLHDSRLGNKNLNPGKSPEDKTKDKVGVVYIAVKLEEGEGRASKRTGNLEKFEVSFEKDREGYAPNLIDLRTKSFEESETLLLERCTSTVAKLASKRGPIKTFSIGISFAYKLKTGDLNESDFKTWNVQQGIRSSYKFLSKHGYHLAIVLCGITEKTIAAVKSENAANTKYETKTEQAPQATVQTTGDDPKIESNTKPEDDTAKKEESNHYDVTEKLKDRLVEHAKNDKRYGDFCINAQKELKALIDKRAVCFAIFVALELDKRQPEEAAIDTARPPSDAEIKEVPETGREQGQRGEKD